MTTKQKRDLFLKSRQQNTNVTSVRNHVNKAQTWIFSETTPTKQKRESFLKPRQQSTNVICYWNQINKAQTWFVTEVKSTKHKRGLLLKSNQQSKTWFVTEIKSTKHKRDLLLKSNQQSTNVRSLWNHGNKEEKCVSIQNTRCWLHIKRASLTLVVIQTEQNRPHIQTKGRLSAKRLNRNHSSRWACHFNTSSIS